MKKSLLERKLEQLNMLIETSSLINSSLRIEEIVKCAIESSIKLIGAEAGSLLLLKQDTDELFFAEAVGEKSEEVKGIKLKKNQGISGWVAENQEPVIVEDAGSDPRFFDGVDKMCGFCTKNILCVPVRAKVKILGALEVLNKREGPFDQDDMLILNALANQVAIALENARLYEESLLDGLTGLYHHKCFELRLQEELKRSKRYGYPLNLFMIDIDHFKAINDRHGHLVGDEILKEIASIFKKHTRLEDFVARYGGEEFAIILPHSPKEYIETAAERLRGEVANLEVCGVNTTVSIGIGHFDGKEKGLEPQQLVDRADRALYRAKKTGRNRVEMISGPR